METAQRIKGGFKPPPFLPYDRQIPIIKEMVQTILDGDRGLVIQPTATGKSVEAAFTARACILQHDMKGLYLYSENEGIEQARIKFEEIFAGNDILCGNFFGYGRDEFVHSADMVFASFQSLNSYHGKWYQTFEQNHFGFLIVNEAHHSQADTYKEVIEYFQCAGVGMTATEKRSDGKDIRDLFPRRICDIPLEQAIAEKWVAEVEYHVLSSGISTQRLKKICADVLESGKKISIKQLNRSIFIKMLDEEMLAEIYKYAFDEDGNPRQTLLYCENIKHVKRLFKALKEDKMSVGAVHSDQANGENRKTMKAFRRSEIQFLLSVNKVNEDIDLPDAEVGAFIRSTDSTNVFDQQLGRLLRRTKKKYKAIILDFVANIDRMVRIEQMIKNVEAFVAKNGESLVQKDLMQVVGNGFSFSFNDELRDLMSLLRVLRSGLYRTWEEASFVAVNAKIQSSMEYYNKCKQLDFRLPVSPSAYYKDFPGWNVFLKRKTVPDGWVPLSQLIKKDEFKHSGVSIKKFILQQQKLKPKMVGNYWAKEGDHCMKCIHPTIAKEVSKKFKGRRIAPEGWVSKARIVREYGISKTVLERFVADFKTSHKSWFKYYISKSAYVEHYHPKLVSLISKQCRIASSADVPGGWKTASMIKMQHPDLSLSAIQKIADDHRTKKPDWFKTYQVRFGLKIIDTEYYHPDFVSVIDLQPDAALLAPEGWVTINPNRFGSFKKANDIAVRYKLSHPHWFKDYSANGEMREHIHADLAQIITSEIESVYVPAPVGWLTCYKLAQNYGIGIKWTRIKKEADMHRAAHPEWFKFFKAANHMKEHYHPDLITLINQEILKAIPPLEGWTTLSKVSEEVKSKAWGLWNPMKEFVDGFRKLHPEWFKEFMAGNRLVEHFHPNLVEKIKEHFANKERE